MSRLHLPAVLLKSVGKRLVFTVTLTAAVVGLAVNARNLGLTPWLGVAGVSLADLAARRITISPLNSTLTAVGDTLLLAATVTDEHGATIAGATLLWASSDSGVVAVDSTGTATARGAGTATVTVSVRTYTARATVTVAQRLAGLVLVADTVVRLREAEELRIAARPLDSRGYPIRGIRPTWDTADSSVVSLDSTGRAVARAPGRTVVTARLEGFSATVPLEVVLAPVTLELVGGGDQRAPAGRALTQPVLVRVLSRSGRPVPAIPVSFTLPEGLGAARPATAMTDAGGRARATWTLAGQPGRQAMRISADGIDSVVTVAAEADPLPGMTRVEVVNATPMGRVGEVLAQPVLAHLTDSAGVALPDIPVAWAALDGGAVEPLAPRTDSVGQARARWTLGPRVGAQRLRVHAGNPRTMPAYSVTATAMAGWPATIRVVSGDGQRGAVGADLREVVVRVTDAFGNPVPDAGVTAAPVAGTVEDSVRNTDANGRAAFRWTLGRSAGRQTVTFKVAGLDSTVASAAVAAPRAPANVSLQVPPGPATAGRAVAVSATVTDDYANPIAGVQVVFTVAAGSVAPARVATDQRGQAAAKWTPAARPAEQALSVTVRGTTVRARHVVTVPAPRPAAPARRTSQR